MVLQGIPNAQQRASVIVPLSSVPGSSVGALAGTFGVVLGSTASSAPSLSIANTTSVARKPAFRAGDSWQSSLSGASSSLRVYLRIWRDGQDLAFPDPTTG